MFTALWTAALVFLHVAPTGYSPLRNAVSEYGVGRFAWGYRAQVLFAAAAAVCLGVELHRRERVLLFVFAAARAAIAAYPTDLLESGTITRTGRIHLLLAAAAFTSICWAASSKRWVPELWIRGHCRRRRHRPRHPAHPAAPAGARAARARLLRCDHRVVLRRRSTDLVDAAALAVFVTIGVLTHDASFAAWLRDLLCFELAWFALWRLPLPARWLVGVTAAVAVRAAFVGHFSAAFYGVALAFTAIFLAIGRAAVRVRG